MTSEIRVDNSLPVTNHLSLTKNKEMFQEITVYIIVAGAFAYTSYSLYRAFNPKHKDVAHCTGCSSASCSVKELKNFKSK